MKKIKLVKQREGNDCGICVLSTILNKPYEKVKNDFYKDIIEDGISLDDAINYLGDHSCSLVYKTLTNYQNKDTAKDEMLRPFADIHVLSVRPYVDADMYHMVLMNKEGEILDPGGETDEFIRNLYQIVGVVGVYKHK